MGIKEEKQILFLRVGPQVLNIDRLRTKVCLTPFVGLAHLKVSQPHERTQQEILPVRNPNKTSPCR